MKKEMTRKAMPESPTIDIIVADGGWTRALKDAEALCRRAAGAAFAAAGDAPDEAEVGLMLCGDERMRDLNNRYRGRDTPTNVLSFPALDPDGPMVPGPVLLGDVVVAFGVASREAERDGRSLADHLCHLVVHGVLHLLGHDHEDTAEAERMESLETEILAGLGIADPHGPVEGAAP